MTKVLITGASGLIGSALSKHLTEQDYQVIHLSRTKNNGPYKCFQWDIDNKKVEDGTFEDIDHVIHLAGAGIADKRWTQERKKQIIDSRVNSSNLLFNEISKLDKKPKTFISASAIGYYGTSTSDKFFSESDPPGNDFQAEVCRKWEEASLPFSEIGIRTLQLRFGVVLSKKGGALKKMLLPTKLGIGSGLGSGKQYFSWIHILDVVNIIDKCLVNLNVNGPYNVVAPNPLTNNEFAKELANVLNKPFFMPNVPAFALKILLGEMATVVLEGNRISSQKIIESGYKFNFSGIEEALENILSK